MNDKHMTKNKPLNVARVMGAGLNCNSKTFRNINTTYSRIQKMKLFKNNNSGSFLCKQ